MIKNKEIRMPRGAVQVIFLRQLRELPLKDRLCLLAEAGVDSAEEFTKASAEQFLKHYDEYLEELWGDDYECR